MADAIWYYAIEDQEKGPVTAAQLKGLAASGQLNPDDLVWREGLDDWKPAREVSGLFTGTAAKTSTRTSEPAPPPATEPAKSKEPALAPQRQPAETPHEPETAPQVSQPAPVMVPGPAPTAATAPLPAAGTPPSPLPGVAEPLRFGRFVGQPLLLIGLMLVVLAKGCDCVGNRYLERLNGKLVLEKSNFDAEWEPQITGVTNKIEKLRTEGDPGGELEVATDKLMQLREKRAEKLKELEQNEWRKLETAIANADSESKVWRYYRELVFLGGTILLTLGLLAVGFTGEGAQKWICLIMLAIITFSIFVYGNAWLTR
jgi:hypothetical protein